MDAFFFVGGYPAGAIAELASQHDVKVVPIDGDVAAKVLENKFFAADTIPGGTYDGSSDDVQTIAVGAQWVTSASQPSSWPISRW